MSLTQVLWIRIHWIRIRTQHFKWIRIQGGWWPKIKGKKNSGKLNFIFFWSKIAIYLSLGLYKGRQATGDDFSAQKRTSSTYKNRIIFALLDPDPDPGTPLNPDPIRIRIRIHNTDLTTVKYHVIIRVHGHGQLSRPKAIKGSHLTHEHWSDSSNVMNDTWPRQKKWMSQ